MTNQKQQNQIPGGWREVTLESITNKIGDGLHTTPMYLSDTEQYFINGNNLSAGEIVFNEKTKTVSEAEYLKYKQALNKDTVLLSINGTIGNVAYYNDEKLILGKSAAYIICSNQINRKFLFLFLNTSRASYYFESELTGSTIRNLSLKSIRGTKLLLPPLPEQHCIVAVLETWDKTLELLDKKIKIKKNIKKGLMQKLLTGEMRLPGFSEQWREVRLQEIGLFSKGNGISKKELSDTGNRAIRYGELYTKHNVKIETIYSFISDQIAETAKLIQKGDIILAGSGETIDEIGKSAVYLDDETCYVGGDTLIYSAREQDSLFLAYLLNNQSSRKKLRKLGQGQSVVHLYRKDLEGMSILIPTFPEQTAIANILTSADAEIKALEKKRDIIADQKKYLLNNLITGQIRVPEDI